MKPTLPPPQIDEKKYDAWKESWKPGDPIPEEHSPARKSPPQCVSAIIRPPSSHRVAAGARLGPKPDRRERSRHGASPGVWGGKIPLILRPPWRSNRIIEILPATVAPCRPPGADRDETRLPVSNATCGQSGRQAGNGPKTRNPKKNADCRPAPNSAPVGSGGGWEAGLTDSGQRI